MVENNTNIQINFESLLKQGFAIIDVRYKDYEVINETYKFIIVHVERIRDDFYQNMLNQNISIKVAALDFVGIED